MTFEEYIEKSFTNYLNRTSDDIRLGQVLFNTLAMSDRSILAQNVVETYRDPYLNNENVGAFLIYVAENWHETP
jgi:hypothetical protein